MKSLLLALLSIAAILLSSSAKAQDEPLAEEEMFAPGVILLEEDAPVEDGYVKATLKNLSKLYWGMGVLDIAKNANIDNFLLINECDIYKQYHNNDIEWAELRKATRDKILREAPTYSRKFEALLPVYLGEYDTETQSFAVRKESDFNSIQQLEIAPNSDMGKVCDLSGTIPGYPRNIIAIFSRPFSLTKVPVNPELAKLYIEETRIKFETLPPKFQSEKYKRIAYLRLKITLSQYKETIVLTRVIRSVFFARWDGFEVYADPYKEKLLYKEDAKSMRPRQRKNFEALKKAMQEQDQKMKETAGSEEAPVKKAPAVDPLSPPVTSTGVP